jgi:hypothetical protein
MITREAELKPPVAFDEIEYDVLRDHAEAIIDDLMSQRKGTSPNEIEQLELDIAVWKGILDKLVDN